MYESKPTLSLVDVVVVAICASVIGILATPALLTLRAEARTEECSDHLRQIAMATLAYNDSEGRLPPGTVAYPVCQETKWNQQDSEFYWKGIQNTSSLALLMPYLEMNDAYGSVLAIAFDAETRLGDYPERGKREYDTFWKVPGTIQTAIAKAPEEAFTNMKLFTCPSDNINDGDMDIFITSQPFVDNKIGTKKWEGEEPTEGKFWRTNYLACGGVAFGDQPEFKRWQGCMTSSEPMDLDDVSDGTSQTIMFAETIGQINDGDRIAAFSWFWGGLAQTRGDLKFMQPPEDGSLQSQLIGNSRYSSKHGFGTKHEDALVTAFADGSIHLVSRKVDWRTWYELCGAKDGGP